MLAVRPKISKRTNKKMETCAARSALSQAPRFSLSQSNICASIVGIVLFFIFVYWLFSPPGLNRGYLAQAPGTNICATIVALILLFVFMYWLFTPPPVNLR